MTWFQAIDTQLIVADIRHLVSTYGLELRTEDTGVGNSSSECGRPWLEVLPWSVTLIWLRVLFWEQTFGCLSPQVDKFKELVIS